MSMEDKMRQAGVNVDRGRLAAQTFEALRQVNQDLERATHIVMRAVLADVRLLNELLGINVRSQVEQYVRDRAQDMKGSAGRRSQGCVDGQCQYDTTPATDLRGASHPCDESHADIDRPRTPLPEESHRPHDSHFEVESSSGTPFPGVSQAHADGPRIRDRPGEPMSAGGESQAEHDSPSYCDLPTPPAPVNPALKAAAKAVLRTAADYQIPGVPGRRLGSITRFDRLNLSINRTYVTELEHAIAEREASGLIRWPDDRTPLEKVVPPAVLTEIRQEIEQAKERAIQSARSLSYGH